jgi:hypothetical protein
MVEAVFPVWSMEILRIAKTGATIFTGSIDYPRYQVEDWGGVETGKAPIGSQQV